MNIVVLVKQVPDSGSERKLDPSDNTVARATADNVINEMDEYAIEEALTVKEAQGGEVTVLTVGPDTATDAIRKALSMGADKAVHVVDPALHGSDALATSYPWSVSRRMRTVPDAGSTSTLRAKVSWGRPSRSASIAGTRLV